MLTPTFDINIEHQLKNKTFASKRIFDILISLILLPFAIPIIFIGALVMIITSKGPALFKQQRVGLNGKSFTMFKLRTMVHSKDGYLDHTVKNDARITKAGAFLRKTKINYCR